MNWAGPIPSTGKRNLVYRVVLGGNLIEIEHLENQALVKENIKMDFQDVD